jgi:EAL domain-containing protein (putative c-di-GMP-specific phosphodiesterase class I)
LTRDFAADHKTRIFVGYAQSNCVVAGVAVAITLAGAWITALLLDGAHSGATNLFYVPIVLASMRFRWPGTTFVALAAGVLSGPMLPVDVAARVQQPPAEWVFRAAVFMAIGALIVFLVEGPHPTIRSRIQDAAASVRLMQALRSGSIEVFYQPIHRVVDGEPEAVEALVRWRIAPGRYLSPDSFLPSAERSGVIVKVDEYVLQHALSAARGWEVAGRPVSVSVNFSAATLSQHDLTHAVRRALALYDFDPGLLRVEITESSLVDDLPAAVRHAEALRALGVKIAIDDFGSGHASLSYLQHFPVDIVKLDRTLLAAATSDERSRLLLEGITDMCARLEMRVIAEGVETSEQLDLVRDAQVPMAQGYLFGRPAPLAEIRRRFELRDH